MVTHDNIMYVLWIAVMNKTTNTQELYYMHYTIAELHN